MQTLKLIENRSPYFIKFELPNLEDIKKLVMQIKTATMKKDDGNLSKTYSHVNLDPIDGQKIIDMFPLSKLYNFDADRVALFITPAYGGGGVHKDGPVLEKGTTGPHNISFNIPIKISDDKCVTKWYDDQTFEKEKIQHSRYSRNVFLDFTNTDKFEAKAQTIMDANNVLFVNTEQWHSFYNNSRHTRIVLTLRLAKQERKNHSFVSMANNLIDNNYLVN